MKDLIFLFFQIKNSNLCISNFYSNTKKETSDSKYRIWINENI